MSKLISISNACKKLNLIDSKTNKPLNHILRYWEKEFSQVRPKQINKRRYYSTKDIEILKFIKILTRINKISIEGVKNILKSNANKLDVNNNLSLKTKYFKEKLKLKSKNLLIKINKIRNNGKKNSSKSSNGS